MIDGIRSNFFEFALMCPKCHKNYGDGFGEGKGQLYTKLTNRSWLLTYGFTESQKMEADEDYEFQMELLSKLKATLGFILSGEGGIRTFKNSSLQKTVCVQI